MDTQNSANANVLILSPDPTVHGGVSTFIELMKSCYKNTNASSIWVGSIQNVSESKLSVIARLMWIPIQVAFYALFKKPDAIHLNPSLDWKSVIRDGLIIFALRITGYKKIIVFFHGWQPQIIKAIDNSGLLKLITKWLLNGTARILVLSPEFKEDLKRIGVEETKIKTTTTMFDGRALLNSVDDKRTGRNILFMSRFVKEKGIFELVDGFAAICSKYPDVTLIMAGDGEELVKLKNHAKNLGLSERIHFAGYIGGNEKYKLLNNCTIYALPTYYNEGMPVALLEAMGAGKPVLTSNVASIPYIIKDQENGIMLDIINSSTVAEALDFLLSNDELCIKIGEKNKVYAWDNFESNKVTQKIEALYSEVRNQV